MSSLGSIPPTGTGTAARFILSEEPSLADFAEKTAAAAAAQFQAEPAARQSFLSQGSSFNAPSDFHLAKESPSPSTFVAGSSGQHQPWPPSYPNSVAASPTEDSSSDFPPFEVPVEWITLPTSSTTISQHSFSPGDSHSDSDESSYRQLSTINSASSLATLSPEPPSNSLSSEASQATPRRDKKDAESRKQIRATQVQ